MQTEPSKPFQIRVQMHHRRNSSIASALGQRERQPRLKAMSPHLVPVPDDYSPSLRYSTFRRRLRTTLIVFIISALAFVGVIRVYIGPAKASLDRISASLHDRSYPPLTRLRLEQEESLPPTLPQPPSHELHIQAQAHADKIPQFFLRLSPSEELGAVVAYLTSLGANAMIPPSIDPSSPVDPDLILEFNTRSPRAREEVKALMADTWAANPVVVISEVRSVTISLADCITLSWSC